jgi:hypothetical protein
MGVTEIESFLYSLTSYRAITCCKRLSLSKSQDGSVSISVTALQGDIAYMKSDMENSPDTIRVVSYKIEGAYASISIVVRSEQDSIIKSRRDYLFKSLPDNIINMYNHYMYPKVIMPSIAEPDLDIRVRGTTDWFGGTGWKVSEILTTLFEDTDFEYSIPNALDYYVYEFRVKRGTPIISILQSLMPFPGLIISHFGNKFFVNSVPASVPDYPISGFCYETGKTVNMYKYKIIVSGLTAWPLAINFQNNAAKNSQESSESTNPQESRELDIFQLYKKDGYVPEYIQTGKHIIILNLVGGVYGIKKVEYKTGDLTTYVQEIFAYDGIQPPVSG